ncbi:MAG: hypothetical protein JRG91_02770 [Deltaproteobacteria bacterium]|nr:hypothetical protein [Deltaproteobacteria bacterium]
MDGTGPKTFRLPPDSVVERGVAIENDGGVVGAVFHVEVGGERCMVYEGRTTAGGTELACTCPARRGCEHVAAVLVHMARRMPAAPASGLAEEPTSVGERSSWPSDSAISASFTHLPAAMQAERDVESLEGDAARVRRIHTVISSIIKALVTLGREDGRETLRGLVTELEKELDGVAAPDLVRPSSELRTLVLSGPADPGQAAMLMERLRGVLGVLSAAAEGREPGRKLEASFLGRRWAFEEARRAEDVLLLEVARNTVLTPFGLRRNKAYYLDLLSGQMHVEQSHEQPGDARNPSVGPFPRRVHAGLMMITPGIPPAPIRLLQYVILPPPGEADLLKLKKASISSASEAFDVLKRTVKTVQAPYPAFVSFSPARVLASGGLAALADGEGSILRLAYRVDEYACRSLALMAATNRIHCVVGMLVWTGHEVAINPLSLLLEHSRGLSLVRLR